jgi:endonuclease YncB( thermonuclease family)
VKYLDRFLAAQRLAQEEGAGLWSRCAGPTPFQSRADGPVDSTGTFLGKNLPSAGMRFVR